MVAVEFPQPFDEEFVTQPQAQHVKQHQCLAVAHRLGGGAVAGAEPGERKVLPLAHVVGELLQRVPPVLRPLAALLLEQMVGEVGGQPLGPVAAVVVGVDAVAPPVVQDLVGIGAVQDERQPDHLRPEQGERGHAEAGLPEVLHQGELGIGVAPDQFFVHGEIAAGHIQVPVGQRLVRGAQPDFGIDPSGRAPIAGKACGDEVDLLLRFG